jgi:hypothetical protein
MSPKGAVMKKWLAKLSNNRGMLAALSMPLVIVGSVVVIAQIEGPKRGALATLKFPVSKLKRPAKMPRTPAKMAGKKRSD